MKKFIAMSLAVAVIAGALYLARGPILERLIADGADATLQRIDSQLLDDGALHVILCGTAAALPDPLRAGACTAIVAGGQLLLIDAGPASWRNVDSLNLPTSKLATVLVTHLHSDHIGDLGEATEQSWIAGRDQPLQVYGPPGIDEVVQGFAEVYRHDVGYRNVHHGEQAMPTAAAAAVAHVITPPTGTAAMPVFDNNGLKVSAFLVNHAPVDIAYGYRIEYRGRVVVISGDTLPSESVRINAAGADLLLHEALDVGLTQRASARARLLGMDRIAQLALDVNNYHTTPVQAAQIAQQAGVKQLVLTHIFPPLPNVVARHLFMQGTAAAFGGQLALGEDGMRIDLPAK
ncbi:MBL fold metallo-hydrolase [Hydrocarboniphaga sp.]|uniref:MBL fold metallo-hydrolase n=1 Tax=Hydrocarboniphaga sp. TaxID=2033016 RepID=UPI003D149810